MEWSARRIGTIWGEYERNQFQCGVMCEEAPVSVFQSVAARERSQLARVEEDRALAWPADSI